MITTVRFIRRDPSLSAEAFKWQYLATQGSMWAQLAKFTPLAGVAASFVGPDQIQSYRDDRGVPPVPVDFDAIEQLSFATLSDLREFVATGALLQVAEQERGLIDEPTTAVRSVGHQEAVAARAEPSHDRPTRLKTCLTVHRRADQDLYQFRDHWMTHHRILEEVAVKMGALYRIHVAFSLGQRVELRADGAALVPEDGFDAFMDMYALPGTDLVAAYEVPLAPEVLRDEDNFINRDIPSRRAIMHEYSIV
ncbi:hypothetical protein [Georgenia sp. AZ-5]|uniref:hypothetical protein n=1 Tax=Georgenia sp. AZ-5 TaxID=3367526 RepID=UPI003754F6FC